MDPSTTAISDILDKAGISFLLLKTRMTLERKNDPVLAIMLETLHENLDILLDETTPDYYTDDETVWINEGVNFLRDMACDPEYSHFFMEEESE